jgi:hypothetical protein
MHRILSGTPTTADPIDALLGPAPSGTTPVDDMIDALQGRLGVALAVLALAAVAYVVRLAVLRRRRRDWGRRALIRSVASRGFGLTAGVSTPGGRVDALTPSWPVSRPPVSPDAAAFPPPEPSGVQPAPWATWVGRGPV